MADETLDATGLKCPLPVLKARKVIKSLSSGKTLEILATDPGAVEDFDAFCKAGAHDLLEQGQENGIYRFLIRVGGEKRA